MSKKSNKSDLPKEHPIATSIYNFVSIHENDHEAPKPRTIKYNDDLYIEDFIIQQCKEASDKDLGDISLKLEGEEYSSMHGFHLDIFDEELVDAGLPYRIVKYVVDPLHHKCEMFIRHCGISDLMETSERQWAFSAKDFICDDNVEEMRDKGITMENADYKLTWEAHTG